MAHELEALANGQTAFASARLSAWHQLGQVTDDCMTAEEVMSTAWLGGWEVRKIPLQGMEISDKGVTKVDCPDKWMTVRTNPATGGTEYLGIVGDDYTTVQNEQVAEVLNLLVDASGAHFETAGSMHGGRSVLSGSGGALLRRRPLRTVRATRRGTRLKQAAQAVRLVELLARCQRGR